MGKAIKKAGILVLIFLIAAAAYFFWPMRGGSEENMTYAARQDAVLPVVYPRMGEREMAPLLGRREELAATAGRGSLLVLPDDRKLPVRIAYAGEISGLRYEIRSMDGENLIERTELSGWTAGEEEINVTLPIQNLLEDGTEYRLGLCAELSDGSAAWYYARIKKGDRVRADEMISLAAEFSRKTLNYEEAQDLTMYMETSPEADNSTFGNVTLKCSFSQITWGNLDVERAGEPSVTLKEIYGNMCIVQVDSLLRRQTESREELYSVTETFTMKWSSQRIYMMDYQRKADELFTGSSSLFSGKRITLGISSGSRVSAEKSPSGRYTAFTAGGELWCYDSTDNVNTRIFSYGNAAEDDPRKSGKNHEIKILTVQDDGQVDFLVHGYMSLGRHEGFTGAALYHYDAESGEAVEQLFFPASESAEMLAEDVETLAHKGANGFFYFYMDGTVYGVDLVSHEYVAVASGLMEGSFAVSADQSRIAWQEGGTLYDARALSVMDLNTGERTQIGEGASICRILGFVGSDCIYGTGEPGNYIMSNGRIMGLFLNSLDILDRNMETAMHYEKAGSYIRNARADESRIHIQLTREPELGFYAPVTEDTLVCNSDTASGAESLVGWYASTDKERVYFIQLSSDVPAGKAFAGREADIMASERTDVLRLPAGNADVHDRFYAYAQGGFLGSYEKFSAAAAAAYERMGFVAGEDGRILWSRGDKSSAHTIRNGAAAAERLLRTAEANAGKRYLEDGSLLLEADGCTLDQILYFVDTDTPVLAYTGEGRSVVLTAYDQSHVTFYDPISGNTERMETSQADAYFSNLGNDYVCRIPAE